jgi:predicted nucleic acid-binding protein
VELADTSAWTWTRVGSGGLRRAFDEAVVDGAIATCDMVRLELLYSARSPSEFGALREDLRALPDCPIDQREWDRALDVYERLAEQGGLHHAQSSMPTC